MSTYTSEPGTRLGGRYRLEDRVASAAGWAAWKAIDETLARAVTVFTFAPGFPRIREVVTAARAASRLNDSRLAQVFDVEDDWDRAYIVMEWAAGDTLDDLLASGPLDPSGGATIVAEAARALAVAHAAGLAHLCLSPESLRWTAGGGVKITGLGIGAALAGATAEDPALTDTRGLGCLLYAALTGCWPGPDYPGLPAAPVADGLPRRPRAVRAGLPAALDEITCQVLQLKDGGHGPMMTTPSQLAAALTAVIPPAPPPQLPPPDPGRPDLPREPRYPDEPADYWSGEQPRAPQRGRTRQPARRQPRQPARVRAAVVSILVLAVMAAVVAAAFQLRKHHSPAASGNTPSSKPIASTAGLLSPLAAQGFDAYNLQDAGNENSQAAQAAIDGNPGTKWTSQYYFSPVFGGLKPGSGLMLDMGKPVQLDGLQIQFGQTKGADVRIEIGNTNARDPATVGALTTVARAADVGGMHRFVVHSHATGQYVLIWFTKLPAMAGGSGKYMAEIYNIVLRGSD
jgi:hypothetical protein